MRSPRRWADRLHPGVRRAALRPPDRVLGFRQS
jgi:hypothetical protein